MRRRRVFSRNRDGNVAMMWALMGTVLIGLLGLTIDFSRAVMVRTELQSAADAAVLAAARQPANVTLEERTASARAFFDSEAPAYAATATVTLTDIGDNGYRLRATAPMPTSLARLITNRDWTVGVNSEAVRGGMNLEVALVLDTTGSMSGQRINDLRNSAGDLVDIIVQAQQTPYYSKMALVTWAMGVNAGPYAADARGSITPGRSISAAAWANGSARSVSAVTKANPAVFTSNGHGFANGDVVWLAGVTGTGSWPNNLNSRWYTVLNASTNTFQLRNSSGNVVSTSSYSGSYPGGATVTRCLEAACQVRVTSNSHGLSNNDWVWIEGVNGMTQINSTTDTAWQVNNVASNAYTLVGSVGPNYSTYTSGGTGYCTTSGCQYYRFTNASNSTRILEISTCVSERTGAQSTTDVAPSTAPVGRNYASPNNPCDSTTGVIPLTTDTTALHNRINSLSASGSTAGQIGAAWGWYMVSPNWGYLWPSASNRPAAYGTPETQKIVVLMTDGAFNSPYCEGVIARDALSGSGSSSDHNSCNATNGSSASQTISICNAMKQRNIIVYTVGFHIDNDATALSVFHQCATDDSHFYLADDRTTLQNAFQQIGQSISQLRLTH
ncbi:MAG: VWA domain-containing protein [Hyphomonadaceae bacterium]|nr:VWA domain-containing protein [Hyphomonadaceae bacterium]